MSELMEFRNIPRLTIPQNWHTPNPKSRNYLICIPLQNIPELLSPSDLYLQQWLIHYTPRKFILEAHVTDEVTQCPLTEHSDDLIIHIPPTSIPN
jgi:hypothetical protein